jgi:HD superfamily phosphodiesterase
MAETDPRKDIDAKTYDFVEEWMGLYDASHDFSHILRVYNLAMSMYARCVSTRNVYNFYLRT